MAVRILAVTARVGTKGIIERGPWIFSETDIFDDMLPSYVSCDHGPSQSLRGTGGLSHGRISRPAAISLPIVLPRAVVQQHWRSMFCDCFVYCLTPPLYFSGLKCNAVVARGKIVPAISRPFTIRSIPSVMGNPRDSRYGKIEASHLRK